MQRPSQKATARRGVNHSNARGGRCCAVVVTTPLLLVVTSTHGAGEVPDNLQPFAEALASRQPDLNALRYGIVSLGDSGYDTFCEGGKTLDRLLEACGATRVGERLEIDASLQELPEDAAEQWLQSWLPQIHHLDLG